MRYISSLFCKKSERDANVRASARREVQFPFPFLAGFYSDLDETTEGDAHHRRTRRAGA